MRLYLNLLLGQDELDVGRAGHVGCDNRHEQSQERIKAQRSEEDAGRVGGGEGERMSQKNTQNPTGTGDLAASGANVLGLDCSMLTPPASPGMLPPTTWCSHFPPCSSRDELVHNMRRQNRV